MSTPWCHATVARAAPHVSLKELAPSTGNTYGPPESPGVPFCGGPAVHEPVPKVAPAVVVAAGRGIVAGGSAGAGSVGVGVGVGVVTIGGGSGWSGSGVSVTVV